MPCPGLDKLTCPKASCEGKGKANIKAVNKVYKAEKAPGGAQAEPLGAVDKKGDLKPRGQGWLQRIFTSCNLFPQRLQPDMSFPFQGEGIPRLRRAPSHRARQSWGANLSSPFIWLLFPGSQGWDLPGVMGDSRGPGRQLRRKDSQRQTWDT